MTTMTIFAMSDIFWTAFFTATPPTIAALTALLVALGALRKSQQVKDAVTENTEITVASAKDVKTVKRLVNGKHDALTKEVGELRQTMEDHGIQCPPHAVEDKA